MKFQMNAKISHYTDNKLTGCRKLSTDQNLEDLHNYIVMMEVNGFKSSWEEEVLTLIGYNEGRKFKTHIVINFE